MLFDLDGTLVDTSGDIAHAVNASLESFGITPVDAATCMRYVGNGLHNTMRGVLGELDVHPDEDTLHMMVERMLEHYREEPWQRSEPYEGIPRFLEKSVAGNLKLGVLSNKDDALVKALVGHWFDHIPFIMVQGAGSDYPLKPNPASALSFAFLAGCNPDQVVFVGDSEVDHRTAVAAGMVPAVVTWGFRKRSSLEASECRPLYDSIEELEMEVFPWV